MAARATVTVVDTRYVDEVKRLRLQREAVLAYLDARAAKAAEPPSIPPPPWVVEIRALLGVAS